jgi:hypothetical protein
LNPNEKELVPGTARLRSRSVVASGWWTKLRAFSVFSLVAHLHNVPLFDESHRLSLISGAKQTLPNGAKREQKSH